MGGAGAHCEAKAAASFSPSMQIRSCWLQRVETYCVNTIFRRSALMAMATYVYDSLIAIAIGFLKS